MAAERIAELKEKLDVAKTFLQDTSARKESEKHRLQRELRVSDILFVGLCRRAKTNIEEIEKQLKAEIKRDRDNWQEWSNAELIRRWETGDFDYEYFKYVGNAKRLRSAYKFCAPNAAPRSVSRIMRVSAQVGAGWYGTPLEAPHCNPQSTKAAIASISPPSKGKVSKNKVFGQEQSTKSPAASPAQQSNDTVSKKKISGSQPMNNLKSVPKLTAKSDGLTAPTSKPSKKRIRDSAAKDSQKISGTDIS